MLKWPIAIILATLGSIVLVWWPTAPEPSVQSVPCSESVVTKAQLGPLPRLPPPPLPERAASLEVGTDATVVQERDAAKPEQAKASLPPPSRQQSRDLCWPGRRENFYYRGVLHWRCRYNR